jgi:hypothetical protein
MRIHDEQMTEKGGENEFATPIAIAVIPVNPATTSGLRRWKR